MLPALEGAIRHTIHAWGLWSVSDQSAMLTRKYMRNYSAGGSKGPARPLGGVRGKEAWGASRDRLSPSPRRRRRRKRKET